MNGPLKVTGLIENKLPHRESESGGNPAVRGEHGLSLLVESSESKLLFDTGAGPLILENANALGLKASMSNLDAIVLSHGHYDHTGGLLVALEHSGKPLPVHLLPGFFQHKVSKTDLELKEIGLPFRRSELERAGASFIEKSGPREVLPDFFVTGKIERTEPWEENAPNFFTVTQSCEFVPDLFDEEQTLAVRTEKGLVIFVGCAHRGIVNSIEAAKKAARTDRVRAVFGGAHLRNCSQDRIDRTVNAIARLDPELVALGHCTGKTAERSFSKALGERFSPLRAGASWTLS